MQILPLSRLQVLKLVDFCFDVAKGSLLAGLGFTVVSPEPDILRGLVAVGGLTITALSLYTGLWLAKVVGEEQ